MPIAFQAKQVSNTLDAWLYEMQCCASIKTDTAFSIGWCFAAAAALSVGYCYCCC